MRGKEKILDRRTKTLREERCGTGYETVQNHRNVKSRSAQYHARHSTDFQAAYFRENVEGLLRVGPVRRDRAEWRETSSSPGRIVDSVPLQTPRAAPVKAQSIAAALLVSADSHLAGAEEKKILQSYFFDETNSRFDGLHGLRSTDGGAAREIVRSAANFAVTQSRWVGEFVIHTHVDHFAFDAVVSRQNVDGGAAAQKVVSHLRGDIFGIRTDAFRGNPVVRCEDK